MDIQAWIKSDKFLIEAGIAVVFLMIVSNKNNCERFITLILDCVAVAGHTILDFSESLLGVLSTVEDFFEALTYLGRINWVERELSKIRRWASKLRVVPYMYWCDISCNSFFGGYIYVSLWYQIGRLYGL